MRRAPLALVATALIARASSAQQSREPPPIADNSFLLEEAYNQERGVVQHISVFAHDRRNGAWEYLFTQEWPLAGQRSQLSYVLPVVGSGGVVRFGDMVLNYRYQLVGTESRLSVAPRLSVLVPTGSAAAGVGAGGVGLQFNLPVSAVVARSLVTHWNAGFTLTPSAQNGAGAHATTTAVNLGASAIWRLRPAFNVLVELAWTDAHAVVGPGAIASEREVLISPGVRWAHNLGGLQIVPGLAFPIGVGPSRGNDAILLYLSLEHPFSKAAP